MNHRYTISLRGLPYAVTISVLASSPAVAQPSDFLSQLERGIVAEHNLARTNPRAYAEHLEAWLPHFDGRLLRLPGRVALRIIKPHFGTRWPICRL